MTNKSTAAYQGKNVGYANPDCKAMGGGGSDDAGADGVPSVSILDTVLSRPKSADLRSLQGLRDGDQRHGTRFNGDNFNPVDARDHCQSHGAQPPALRGHITLGGIQY